MANSTPSAPPPDAQQLAVEQLIEMIRASAVAETKLCEAIRQLTTNQAGMESRLREAIDGAADKLEDAQTQVIRALDRLQDAVGAVHKDMEITAEVEAAAVRAKSARLDFFRSLATSRPAMVFYCLIGYLLLEALGVDGRKWVVHYLGIDGDVAEEVSE